MFNTQICQFQKTTPVVREKFDLYVFLLSSMPNHGKQILNLRANSVF